MTDRVTRIYEGALQVALHRFGPGADIWTDPKQFPMSLLDCVEFAITLDNAVERQEHKAYGPTVGRIREQMVANMRDELDVLDAHTEDDAL